MKIILIGILILSVSVPSVMAHPVINGTEVNHKHGEDSMVYFPSTSGVEHSQFITIVIGVIVITMIITALVVYREDIISIKKH